MKKKTMKIAALIICLALVFSQSSLYFASAADVTAAVTVTFDNEKPGSAAGKVSLSSDTNGDYEIYWGDANGEKLTVDLGNINAPFSEVVTVSVKKGSGSADLNEFNAIPEGAETVLAYYDGQKAGTYEIPDSKLADNGELIYNFGTLSDLHFNRYDKSGSDDSEIAFPRALSFYEKVGVSIIGMPGDLSKNGEKSAYEKFNKYVSEYDFPVLTSRGNHDCRREYTYENWSKYINNGVYGEEKLDGVTLSDNGLDFTYCDDAVTHGDVFIFLSQTSRKYILPGSRLVTDDQLVWLKNQLEENKDKTVYLFFHTFLSAPYKNPLTAIASLKTTLSGEGNVSNDIGLFYPLVYTIGSSDEAQFRSLLTEYKNVVFFNGHSHWAYSAQSRNPRLNITDYDGTTCTMVHISSVGAPRTPSFPLWSSNSNTMSEGTLVSVYEDSLILYGIDFVNGEALAYATYTVAR